MNLARQQNKNFRAFTLIEVLLAVGIAAIVLVAVNAVFFGALHLRAGVTDATEQTLPLDHAVAMLKRDLLGIVPPGVLPQLMSSDTMASGLSQPAALEIFTTTGVVNDDVPWGDIQKIDYSLQDPTNRTSSTGKDLIRNVTRNLLATSTEKPEQQFLIGDVQNLKFSYYDGTNWNDAWSATLSNIPTAIKVMIDFSPSKTGKPVKSPVEVLVPIVSRARTNQTDATN
jgi:type II secretion system protein J